MNIIIGCYLSGKVSHKVLFFYGTACLSIASLLVRLKVLAVCRMHFIALCQRSQPRGQNVIKGTTNNILLLL